ncbi:cation:proton antiporter [Nitratifractor sp.]|uniref:cation:proton antiporter n=1 Tax=Nitratifractor sp. TaxID=2268144 RepID=UPI0025E00242|nr:cation:proton antiporter [Nitratifractor sp.]
MHEHLLILGITIVILGYGYFSRLLGRLNISGPMVFVTVGILLSPLVLGGEPVRPNAEAVQIVAEIALIVVLFSDASAISLARLKPIWKLPSRLLFVAMPISILLTYITAKLFFPEEHSALYLMLLALILAPTDAALGKAVVSDTRLPEKVRNTINVESGLNDGIVFPLLLMVLALMAGDSGQSQSGGPLLYIARQILFGALAGALVGWLGARLGRWSIDRGWMEPQYYNLVPLALAIFAYYFAEFLGGNGYIGAFFGGLLLGNSDETLRRHVEEFAESEGELLVMVSFLIFGLVFVPASLPYWDLKALLFALLSLTLLRMLPVAVGFGRLKLDLPTRLFIGWFGPRGIASILYILVAAHQLGGFPGHERIIAVAALTILLSIFLHGLSAQPLVRLYARWVKSTD